MQKETALADILYTLCSIVFYILIVAFGAILALEILTNNGKIGNFYSNFHSSRGYAIPVELKITPENPMFNDIRFTKYEEGVDKAGVKTYTKVREYANSISSEDSLNFKTIVSIEEFYGLDNFDLITDKFSSNGYVYVEPKTSAVKVVILFRTYLNLIFLITIFFLLRNMFKSLRIRIQFSQRLYKSIQLLGIIIIVKVLLYVISNSFLGKTLSQINVEPIDKRLSYLEVLMHPRLDIDYTLLIVGFSLIVLSSVLKTGSSIQQENDLTI